MGYQEALSDIHSLKRFGSKPGLERMTALMDLLGNPQERLRIVHIAGTNGKGSTAAMIAGVLRTAGCRTGLYVSPYVLDFRERIQIDNEMIPQSELTALVAQIKPLAEQVGEITEFEFVTAAAFVYFANSGCEIVVLETGLGGRFDATNVIKHPLLTVITSIGLDHTEILGETIEQIAFEKCGILKQGVQAVTFPAQDTDALAVILEQAAEKGCTVVHPNVNAAKDVHMDIFGTDLVYQGHRLHIPLAGKHQILNAMTAFSAIDALQMHHGFGGLMQHLEAGFAAVRFPARMEILCRDPLTILDGAHNPSGAQVLADALALLGEIPVTAVMGVLADKNTDGVLRALAPHLKRVICVTPASPRALSAHALAARADGFGLQASAAHGIEEAWQLAQAVAAAEGGAVVICGSLYLAGEMRALILQTE